MANNRGGRPDRDRERYEEQPDQFMRDMVGWVKESCPQDYMRFLKTIGCFKMDEAFEENEFCVISGFKESMSKKRNLEQQFILAEEMRCAGFGFVPHTGFWDNLSHRCLFVPYLNREQCRGLCRKYELPYFVHGRGGQWTS
jgi:hypothetical protein